jgi:tetratricopeptide (TPR) repeat protein
MGQPAYTERRQRRSGAMVMQAEPSYKGSIRLGSYLRKLRAGYGYSLRRVEERARAEGGELDNSQLSRYEKGICYPSFDKLRILASVFNVSIQSFSDVVDLESYEEFKPETGDPGELIDLGSAAMKTGEHGKAFAYFERALEILLDSSAREAKQEMIARARINQAAALTRVGKLALAEQELRYALREAEGLQPKLRARALLALANIHADQGDNFLSEIEAERAYRLARDASMERLAAMALHTQGRVLSDQGYPARAIERFRKASKLYAECGEQFEAIRLRISIGSCYIALGKYREGIRILRSSLNEARSGSHRRLESFSWSSLGEAYYRQKDNERARKCFRESNALAVYNNEKQTDILFFNAYYDWMMALEEDNPTREKIAFGRLKTLRSCLERKFVEVEAFDEYVERGRYNA